MTADLELYLRGMWARCRHDRCGQQYNPMWEEVMFICRDCGAVARVAWDAYVRHTYRRAALRFVA